VTPSIRIPFEGLATLLLGVAICDPTFREGPTEPPITFTFDAGAWMLKVPRVSTRRMVIPEPESTVHPWMRMFLSSMFFAPRISTSAISTFPRPSKMIGRLPAVSV